METQSMKKVCALTFDDGPSLDTTPEILDILEKYGFTCSFMVIGKRIATEEHKEIMRRAVRMGCTIENHSTTHGRLPDMTEEEIFKEYEFTQSLVHEVVGDYPQFFRAPGLAVSDKVYETVPLTFANGRCGSADWNSNPDDPVTSDLEARVKGILDVAEDGLIYLFHDSTGNHLTPEALRITLPILIERGYTFVNLRELFRIKGQALTPHAKLGWSVVQGSNQ